jgi:metal-sulfur cluster biosynthetic enzyme
MSDQTSSNKLSEDTVREALMQVIDPEFDFDIVNLGLVYDVMVEDRKVVIDITMTDPACPIADQIVASARAVVMRTFSLVDVAVNVVWSPRWSWEMMSDEAKICMGYPV